MRKGVGGLGGEVLCLNAMDCIGHPWGDTYSWDHFPTHLCIVWNGGKPTKWVGPP